MRLLSAHQQSAPRNIATICRGKTKATGLLRNPPPLAGEVAAKRSEGVATGAPEGELCEIYFDPPRWKQAARAEQVAGLERSDSRDRAERTCDSLRSIPATCCVHFNPLKHRRVSRAQEWPYSSFHVYVKRGHLPADWAGDVEEPVTDFGEWTG